MKFSEISVKRDDEREHINELIDYQGFCAGPKMGKQNLNQWNQMVELWMK